MELEEILTKLKDTNALIDPTETIKLIEAVGGYIDDLDLELIELEESFNNRRHLMELEHPDWPQSKLAFEVKLTVNYQALRERTVLLKRLRRHYRLLNTKLNLLTKPKGR